MSDSQTISVYSSSSKWVPDHLIAPIFDACAAYGADSSNSYSDLNYLNTVRNFRSTSMSRTAYPGWLNFSSWVALSLLPIGFILLVALDVNEMGLLFMGLGFLGIWVLGNISARVKPHNKQVVINNNGS